MKCIFLFLVLVCATGSSLPVGDEGERPPEAPKEAAPSPPAAVRRRNDGTGALQGPRPVLRSKDSNASVDDAKSSSSSFADGGGGGVEEAEPASAAVQTDPPSASVDETRVDEGHWKHHVLEASEVNDLEKIGDFEYGEGEESVVHGSSVRDNIDPLERLPDHDKYYDEYSHSEAAHQASARRKTPDANELGRVAVSEEDDYDNYDDDDADDAPGVPGSAGPLERLPDLDQFTHGESEGVIRDHPQKGKTFDDADDEGATATLTENEDENVLPLSLAQIANVEDLEERDPDEVVKVIESIGKLVKESVLPWKKDYTSAKKGSSSQSPDDDDASEAKKTVSDQPYVVAFTTETGSFDFTDETSSDDDDDETDVYPGEEEPNEEENSDDYPEEQVVDEYENSEDPSGASDSDSDHDGDSAFDVKEEIDDYIPGEEDIPEEERSDDYPQEQVVDEYENENPEDIYDPNVDVHSENDPLLYDSDSDGIDDTDIRDPITDFRDPLVDLAFGLSFQPNDRTGDALSLIEVPFVVEYRGDLGPQVRKKSEPQLFEGYEEVGEGEEEPLYSVNEEEDNEGEVGGGGEEEEAPLYSDNEEEEEEEKVLVPTDKVFAFKLVAPQEEGYTAVLFEEPLVTDDNLVEYSDQPVVELKQNLSPIVDLPEDNVFEDEQLTEENAPAVATNLTEGSGAASVEATNETLSRDEESTVEKVTTTSETDKEDYPSDPIKPIDDQEESLDIPYLDSNGNSMLNKPFMILKESESPSDTVLIIDHIMKQALKGETGDSIRVDFIPETEPDEGVDSFSLSQVLPTNDANLEAEPATDFPYEAEEHTEKNKKSDPEITDIPPVSHTEDEGDEILEQDVDANLHYHPDLTMIENEKTVHDQPMLFMKETQDFDSSEPDQETPDFTNSEPDIPMKVKSGDMHPSDLLLFLQRAPDFAASGPDLGTNDNSEDTRRLTPSTFDENLHIFRQDPFENTDHGRLGGQFYHPYLDMKRRLQQMGYGSLFDEENEPGTRANYDQNPFYLPYHYRQNLNHDFNFNDYSLGFHPRDSARPFSPAFQGPTHSSIFPTSGATLRETPFRYYPTSNGMSFAYGHLPFRGGDHTFYVTPFQEYYNLDSDQGFLVPKDEFFSRIAEFPFEDRQENFVPKNEMNAVQSAAVTEDRRSRLGEHFFPNLGLERVGSRSFRSGVPETRIPYPFSPDWNSDQPDPSENDSPSSSSPLIIIIEPDHNRYNPDHGPDQKPVHNRYEPVQDQSEPVYDHSEPVQDRSEPVYDRSKPVHNRYEPVQDRSEPVYDRSEPVHNRYEPVHDRSEPDLASALAEPEFVRFQRGPHNLPFVRSRSGAAELPNFRWIPGSLPDSDADETDSYPFEDRYF